MNYRAGAINSSGYFTLPDNAIRGEAYLCPDCYQPLILKKGEIKAAHFAHYAESRCSYYSHAGESQKHKEAKWRLANMLYMNKIKYIKFTCGVMIKPEWHCSNSQYCKINIDMNDRIVVEYRGSGWVADVAVLTGEKIKYIFEIMVTHRTTNPRPEPWFEIEADSLLEESAPSNLYSIRNNHKCKAHDLSNNPEILQLPKLKFKIGSNGLWHQHLPCTKCGRDKYNPVFAMGYRAICKLCLFDTDITAM